MLILLRFRLGLYVAPDVAPLLWTFSGLKLFLTSGKGQISGVGVLSGGGVLSLCVKAQTIFKTPPSWTQRAIRMNFQLCLSTL